ncbi:omptin family outer membrane protease, partial [Salmonella enterica subsp. enterica serovar Kentucky]|nr:omptin family outer membrane protease [Salmonella enterica subsp. enterica serovar Kentucky]
YITSNAKIFAEFAYSKYEEGKGGTQIIDKTSGDTAYFGGDAAWDIKDPAWLAKLMARQRRHSFEDRHLPLFRENQNPEALFNSDG